MWLTSGMSQAHFWSAQTVRTIGSQWRIQGAMHSSTMFTFFVPLDLFIHVWIVKKYFFTVVTGSVSNLLCVSIIRATHYKPNLAKLNKFSCFYPVWVYTRIQSHCLYVKVWVSVRDELNDEWLCSSEERFDSLKKSIDHCVMISGDIVASF